MQLLLVSFLTVPYLYNENRKFIGLLQEISHTSWLKNGKEDINNINVFICFNIYIREYIYGGDPTLNIYIR